MDITSYILAKKYIDELLKNQGSGPMEQEYIDNKIAELVNSAPEMLDTIGELAKAFQDNEEVIDALNKAVSNKVDKEDGKVLSSNDFTDELLEKVNNIENLSAKDWNQNDETSFDYIKNRPFYEGEPIEKIILPETNFKISTTVDGVTFAQVVPFNFNAEANKTYDVYLNDVKYTLNSFYTDEPGITTFIIGDLHLIDSPFVIKYVEAISIFNITFKDALDVNEITLSIKENQPNIVQLDRKYIDYIPGKISEVGKVHIIDEQEYTVNKNAEIFNDYDKNIAVGIYSHAEGCETKAIGNKSHAEGFHTTALGENSHAEGYGTEALVYNSHAEGTNTVASGHGSHAEGNLTIAASDYQHVEGRTNIEDTENKYIHIAGNGGLPEDRSNAYTLDWEGNAWFAGDVYVGSTSGINKDEGSKKLLTADDLVQSDWNQNDETALDYVKNRPFYEGELEEYYIIPETTITDDSLTHGLYSITGSVPLKIGTIYEVLFNGEIYSAECYEGNIGASIGDQQLQEYPFYLFDGGYASMFRFTPQENPLTFYIKGYQQEIKTIERKFIKSIAGEDVEGRTFEYNNKYYTQFNGTYTAKNGAEIFNDYKDNIAAGAYSHAEGYNTAAMFMGAHAEGSGTLAFQTCSHAEGSGTIASGLVSHAEGDHTIAFGDYQHTQGCYNIEDVPNDNGKGKYLHIVGNGNIEKGVETRSNAHTLDWEGNAWFQGDVYVGSTSGVNRDEGSKKLATEEYINIRVPAWTAEDEGKVLKIVNGTPTWV